MARQELTPLPTEKKTKKGKSKMNHHKFNIETIKTIIITALIVGITTFIAGMFYQQSQAEQVRDQAETIVQNMRDEVSRVEKSKQ